MKIILCSLLMVAVLIQQTRACEITSLEKNCNSGSFKYSFNRHADSCLVSDLTNHGYCTMSSMTSGKCSGGALSFHYDDGSGRCVIKA